MADSPDLGLGPIDTEFVIWRTPDLQTITTGAQMRYVCEWRLGRSSRPQGMGSDGRVTDTHGIRWYRYSNAPIWGRQFKNGPLEDSWTYQWSEDPGQYVMVAEIRASGEDTKYLYKPQQIGYAAAILDKPLNGIVNADGPTPEEALGEIKRFRALLPEMAKKLPPSDPSKHEQSLDKWEELESRLTDLIKPSAGKRRYPIRAVHLSNLNQAQRVLMLYLVEMDEVMVPAARFSPAGKLKKWALVDWTDPSDPRFRGTYEGSGSNVLEAVGSCLTAWDNDNRYPEGHVTFDIPTDLYPMVGGDKRRQMDTDGKNFTDQVIIAFQWLALGTLFIAGFCYVFVAIPTVMALATATSMVASTAGATLSIGQRWRDGIFDWQADAIDGLTIVGNLVGAGSWVRGARVAALTNAGNKVDYVFFGARVGADAAQGILIAEQNVAELLAVMNDPNLTPEERAKKMLLLFGQLSLVGLMTYINFRASKLEADNLDRKPVHLENDPRTNTPEQRLKDLVDENKSIDTTKPPVTEGHTSEGTQKTKVTTPVGPAVTKLVKEHLTDFAKKYPKDGHPWRQYKITSDEIHLVDKDGFMFQCSVDEGDLYVDFIVTMIDPKTTSPHLLAQMPPATAKKFSTVLRADELYPLAYKHFEQVGNPVMRVHGEFAWDNYDAIKRELVRLQANGLSLQEASKKAVESAKSFKYHRAAGFSQVTYAEDMLPRTGDSIFKYKLDKPD